MGRSSTFRVKSGTNGSSERRLDMALCSPDFPKIEISGHDISKHVLSAEYGQTPNNRYFLTLTLARERNRLRFLKRRCRRRITISWPSLRAPTYSFVGRLQVRDSPPIKESPKNLYMEITVKGKAV